MPKKNLQDPASVLLDIIQEVSPVLSGCLIAGLAAPFAMPAKVDLYSDLVRRSFEGYADLMDQTLRSRGVQLDSGPGGLLTLQGAAGVRATATVWMHNTTAQPASAEPRLTSLASHDGRTVPASAARFQPAVLTIGPGASTSATVEVALGHVLPGVYHGHVLARGLPDVALPVRLLVRAGNGRP